MDKAKRLFIGGAHRGGWEFSKSYLNQFVPPSEIIIADPKGKRAITLVDEWRKHGTKAVGHPEPCERVVESVPQDSIVMLSVDSILPMVDVMVKRELPTQWQILGRSTSDIIVGFSGTIPSNDGDCRKSSETLLKNLSPYALPVSSEHIRTSILHNKLLAFTRKRISDHSAESVFNLAQGQENGGLQLFLGTQNFPLTVIAGEIEPFREIEKRALETDNPHPIGSKDYAVAVVLANHVDLFMIEEYGARKRFKFFTPFGQPIPSEETSAINPQSAVLRTPQVETAVTD